MNFNNTHIYFKRLADYITFGKIAQMCGKEIQTAEAWGREPESNGNPHGTGKRNPMDVVLRLTGLAHKEDPGLAREMAEVFTEYVDYLDGSEVRTATPINELLGNAAKEHTDYVVEILHTAEPDWLKVIAEIKQAEAALNQVYAYARSRASKAILGEAVHGAARRRVS